MAIITISRQNGSLGDEIADALAARLGTTVVSRKYALENFFGEINQGTLDRLNESAKFFDLTLPGSDRTYADILVERIRALASENNRYERLGISSRKIRDTKGTFHAKMGSIKDRNGLDLTEADDIKKRCKNTQKSCTKKIFMSQIITMV